MHEAEQKKDSMAKRMPKNMEDKRKVKTHERIARHSEKKLHVKHDGGEHSVQIRRQY